MIWRYPYFWKHPHANLWPKKTSASHLYMPHLLPFIASSGCLESTKLWEVSPWPFPCQTPWSRESHVFLKPRPQHSNVESQKAHFGNSSSDSSLHLKGKKQNSKLARPTWQSITELEKERKKTARTFPGVKIIMEKFLRLEEVHLLHCAPTPRGVDTGWLVDSLIDCLQRSWYSKRCVTNTPVTVRRSPSPVLRSKVIKTC